jgi:DNA-binding protein YbaB
VESMEDSPAELRARAAELSATIARNEAIVAEWSGRELTGSADHGGIVATVDAIGSLRNLEVSPSAMRRLDSVSLAEAIVTAVHRAEDAAATAKEEMLDGLRLGDGPSLGELTREVRSDLSERTGWVI